MSLEDKLFEVLNNHMQEKYGKEKPKIEQILEDYIEVNSFYSKWVEESTDFIQQEKSNEMGD